MPRATGHLTVAAVGRLRERHWQTVQDDYAHRLSRYTDFQLVEVKDAVGRGQPDAVAAAREGEQLRAAAAGARLALMTATGREMTSSTILFGFGAGTAWYFWSAHRTRDPATIAAVGRTTGPLAPHLPPRTGPRRLARATLPRLHHFARRAVSQVVVSGQ